jgi:hypothetical protein
VLSPVLSPIAWLANKLYAIEEKSKEVHVANVYCHGPCLCLLSSTTPLSTVQTRHTRVQCNDKSTSSYENQSVVFCTQNCIKACQNCFKHCLTVKLLKFKVTLFNTCEKLKIDTT